MAGNYRFVQVNEFQANKPGWQVFGNVSSVSQRDNKTFQLYSEQKNVSLMLYILSDRAFRVRFSPVANDTYDTDNSIAVVNRGLGQVSVTIEENNENLLQLNLGYITLHVELKPYRLRVYRGAQLIHQDIPGSGTDYLGRENKNIMYASDGGAIANLKQYPVGAKYVGFGEKAGAQLLKNEYTMTFFNYNNFIYATGPVPAGNQGGPLNPSEALYNSMPFMLEVNPQPQGDYAGPPYAYALFLDNVSQSYFNMGSSDYSNMSGRYYFGALYGELDYYFMADGHAAGALSQYVKLTGPSPMPPKFALGFQQGCYGYFDNYKLLNAAETYRKWEIPIDGLHIDVDFQDNYRTFTNSELKFPKAKEMFTLLKALGFKCSTNITGMVTSNPYDEIGQVTPYSTVNSGRQQQIFIYDTTAGEGPDPGLFVAKEEYGQNFGTNPYPYPVPASGYYREAAGANPPEVNALSPEAVIGQTLQANEPYNVINLGTSGFYPDMGKPEVQAWWGEQYQHLVDIGLEMIWQDMTCPAMAGNFDNQDGNYIQSLPLDLEMYYFGEYKPNAEIHNAFALNLISATYNGLRKLRPDKRAFIIGRGGYAGVHRYAALWTGDSATSWDFLRINIPEVLNFGLSGVPLSGCDIGGFASGSGCVPFDNGGDPQGTPYVVGGEIQGGVCNYELFTRWVTMGAFLPWFRIHYDGYNKAFQEPYNYGAPVPQNCRLFISIRYRLLQIFYDAMYRNTVDGMPVCRALMLNFPTDLGVYGNGGYWLWSEFMVGDAILVAPILDPHETANPPSAPVRDIYLPMAEDGQTQWYAYQNNQAPLLGPVAGGTVITNYYAPLGTENLSLVPIYIRAGAILPMRDVEQYVGQVADNPITFNIYPGQDSSYTLYLDDGESVDNEQGKYRVVEVSHKGVTNGQQVEVVRQHDNYTPNETYFYVAFIATQQPAQVWVNGDHLPNIIRATPEEAAQALAAYDGDAYYYNASIQTTYIKVMDNTANIQVISLWE